MWPDPTWIDHHPRLATAFAAGGSFLAVTSRQLAAWLVKGAILMPLTLADVQKALAEFEDLVKTLAPLVPGATPEEKAKTIDNVIDPVVDGWLSEHGASPAIIGLVNNVVDWVIARELKPAA